LLRPLSANGRLGNASGWEEDVGQAVEEAFGAGVDHAVLVKRHGDAPEEATGAAQRKYDPGECVRRGRLLVAGKPDRDHKGTSYAKRQNPRHGRVSIARTSDATLNR
jgi:hypothetical protein